MFDVPLLELGAAHDANRVGGKARGLATMIGRGLPVPPGFVVPVDTFIALAGEAFTESAKLADSGGSADAAARAAETMHGVGLSEEFLDRLTAAWDEIAGSGPVAVRSSAVGEDGAAWSFAGEHDSFLGVTTPDELADALRGCWASLFTKRAIAYRAQSRSRAAPMAVVVQRMLRARSSGVMMSLNPSNGDRSSVVVESVWGLAEPLVSGQASPDRFVLNRITGEVRRRELVPKTTAAVLGTGGSASVAVAPDEIEAASLDESTLSRLHASVPALEACAGGPADAEFAVDDGGLWFVQVRPETYWSQRRTVAAGSSVIESVLATVTKPTEE
ncbi:MAG: PEP/pyruvate-binding domain-containing protein [Pseudonocardia sp.]|nr:PEP/pyruvate-binding domain-containing protein [Pseudonocardia sp.]